MKADEMREYYFEGDLDFCKVSQDELKELREIFSPWKDKEVMKVKSDNIVFDVYLKYLCNARPFISALLNMAKIIHNGDSEIICRIYNDDLGDFSHFVYFTVVNGDLLYQEAQIIRNEAVSILSEQTDSLLIPYN